MNNPNDIKEIDKPDVPNSKSGGAPSRGFELTNPLNLLILAVGIMALSSVAVIYFPQSRDMLQIIQLVTALACLALIGFLIYCLRTRFLIPLHRLRTWTQNLRSGNFSTRMPAVQQGQFSNLADDINQLGEALHSLSREMDERVNRQTISLKRKTRSLEILYDVAARSNSAKDIRQLLNFFLDTLTEIVYAHAGTVRLATDDYQMELVGSVALDDETIEKVRLIPIERCLCAQDFSRNMILCQASYGQCQNQIKEMLFAGDKLDNIAIPLRYRNRTLGIYNLFVEKLGLTEREDIKDILTNIGQHLSMAIEKAHWDVEAKRISIMEERAMLANELHDSLAQTLASLRFRVNMLHQELKNGEDISVAENEVELLKDGLEEANLELRELLSHFRIRMDERGLIPATEDLVERFKQETGIHAFFQNECSKPDLSPMLEIHILHIIQEALANIRKHSNASNVRVLVRCSKDQVFRVLVEDDGIGIQIPVDTSLPGEHVGLTIMRERANHIGARLNIESEAGEGTRVELELDTTNRHASNVAASH